MDRVKLLNTHIDNVTMNEALERIVQLIESGGRHYVVTPNVDHIIKLEKDKEFQEVYQHASLSLTDGQPLVWLSKLYGMPIKQKVSGSDLFPLLCEMAAKKGYSMFFLGAAEGVSDIAAKRLKARYPGLQVVGTCSPQFGFEKDQVELERVISLVNCAKPHILIVALGAPKQEKFMYRYREQLGAPVSLGLGASLDFEAGTVKRAPAWMSKCGLEWFYRFCKEPKRMFKRYLIDDIKIIGLAWKYRKEADQRMRI